MLDRRARSLWALQPTTAELVVEWLYTVRVCHARSFVCCMMATRLLCCSSVAIQYTYQTISVPRTDLKLLVCLRCR